MDVQFRADPALLPHAVPGGVRFDDADITPCDFLGPARHRAHLAVLRRIDKEQGRASAFPAWLADRRGKKIGRHEDALKVISRVSKSRPC
jgi:hypothetical protein